MSKSLAAEVRFIEPMYALGVRNLPEESNWQPREALKKIL